jgi:hypothetical protein
MKDKRRRRRLRDGGRPSGNTTTNQTTGAPRRNKKRRHWAEARAMRGEGAGREAEGGHRAITQQPTKQDGCNGGARGGRASVIFQK